MIVPYHFVDGAEDILDDTKMVLVLVVHVGITVRDALIDVLKHAELTFAQHEELANH